LKKGERFNERFVFMKSLEQTHLKVGDKERLWQSLKRIALKG
jgi:chorismate mutase